MAGAARAALQWLSDRQLFAQVEEFVKCSDVSAQLRFKRIVLEVRQEVRRVKAERAALGAAEHSSNSALVAAPWNGQRMARTGWCTNGEQLLQACPMTPYQMQCPQRWDSVTHFRRTGVIRSSVPASRLP
mmetsp:Transcript_2013/g.4762  ORF Transcript_2013/g.4762 Transcript_2013/m.4762 type:complete len:130 (-) Transcript_2013:775-1164(-)